MSGELTWEYLYSALEGGINSIQDIFSKTNAPPNSEKPLEAMVGLYNVLPKLQAHPQVHPLIPSMGVTVFHWWPTEQYRLTLDTWDDRTKYRFMLFHNDTIEAQTTVAIDEVV